MATLVQNTVRSVLLVTQSFNCVLAGGAQGWIESADAASEKSYQKRDDNPARLNLNSQTRYAHHGKARQESKQHAYDDSKQADQDCFFFYYPCNRCFGHSQRFEDTDLTSSLGYRGVHCQQNH